MRFGRDENNQRILPFKGGRSTCPLCKGTLIAKCGDIYSWHWQHFKAIECDSFNEPETAWHIGWKNKFPEEQQEVILERNGIKHIADVKNRHGIVIEFQNSPISMATIEARETFYEGMIWVINARNFVENFSIWSLVTKNLKALQHDHDASMRSVAYHYDSESKEQEKQIEWLEKQLLRSEELLRSASARVKENTKTTEQVHTITDAVIAKWAAQKPSWNNYYSEYNLSSLFTSYMTLQLDINKEHLRKTGLITKVDRLNQAELFPLGGDGYRLLGYSEIEAYKAFNTVVVEKSQLNTMFPITNKVRSPEQLMSFRQKQNLYVFAMDCRMLLVEMQQEIADLKAKISELEVSKAEYYKHVNNHITSYFKKYHDMAVKNEESSTQSIVKTTEEITALQAAIWERKEEYEKERDIYVEASDKELEADRLKAMKKWKGLYGFKWKNERKSWAETTCPVFFDIGKDYLFQRVRDETLRKIKLEDFFNIYR